MGAKKVKRDFSRERRRRFRWYKGTSARPEGKVEASARGGDHVEKGEDKDMGKKRKGEKTIFVWQFAWGKKGKGIDGQGGER